MEFDGSIADIIRKIVKDEFVEVYGIPCTVISVDTGADPPTCDCKPIDDDADILGVKLKASPGNSMVLIPAVDSVVYVGMINQVAGYVTMFSQVDSIKFLDGSFGGLIKIDDYITETNKAQTKINELITAFNTWTPVANDGGAALKTALGSWVAANLTLTVKSDVENTKITHGDV